MLIMDQYMFDHLLTSVVVGIKVYTLSCMCINNSSDYTALDLYSKALVGMAYL